MIDIAPIMVIDNDVGMCALIEAILTDNGYSVTTFNSPFKAVAEIKNGNYSLVITDVKMPGMDGIQVLEQIKRFNKTIPVIIITAHATLDISIQALRKGADDMILKPFEAGELVLRVNNVLKNNALFKENIKLKEELRGRFKFENIIGISRVISNVLEKVKKIAPTDIPVLIIGESGTGKELIAQAIHYNSLRKDKSFIALNCGALPQNLIESELFGYKKGAFTGAAEDKAGLIETAHEGTLFLDEVGNLSMDAQKGLLRFLQEKELRRIGDNKNISVDVRIISATNLDLQTAIKEGKFREDLYYRLTGITINLPPLRERVEDIPLLASYFISLQNKKFNKNCAGFTPEAMDALISFNWPGNIRQLRNVIEAAYILSDSKYIDVDVIEQFLNIKTKDTDDLQSGEYYTALAKFEKDYFQSLLQKAKGNVEEAAKRAGLNLATLYRKIKKYGLKKEEF
ncbi:MAG: sigma-54 dependent transcriptional regulator [Thermodesulfovibrionales bacterium]|nr:sigma-54 dependent transcriptional regulator [Thermodesulfovibrionales bacterium]